MSAPALAGKRAKVKRKRRQDDRQDTQQDRKKDRKQAADRKQADRKQDHHKDRGQGTTQEGGQPVELGGGALPAASAVASDALSAEDRYVVLLADGTSNAMRATSDIAASTPGIIPTHIYEHVFNGFAAVIPNDQLDDVKSDP